MNEDERALAWASQRKRADETVIISACPCCKTGKMIRILSFNANAPPNEFLENAKSSIK